MTTALLDPALISFRRMVATDLTQLHRWYTESNEIRRWFSKDEPESLEGLREKYMPLILGEVPTHPFFILYSEHSIGYIQTYRIIDHVEYAQAVSISENAAGLDLCIGDERFLHKGLGADVLRRFLRSVVFRDEQIVSCIVGPESDNKVAIRAYEKVGFQYLKTVQGEGDAVPEYLMRLSRMAI